MSDKPLVNCPHCNAPRGGRKKASGWPDNEGPLTTLRALFDLPAVRRRYAMFYTGQPGQASETVGYRPSWVDHPYRLRLADGRWCYVAEPYGVTDWCLRDIETLRVHGYRVEVSEEKALHYPGGTTAILITPEAR